MGLLDNNKVIVTPNTGLEGSFFKPVFSTDAVDVWTWDSSLSGKYLRLTFRDIFAWSDNNTLYLVKGKITDTPTAITVNETNFPNIRKDKNDNYPTIVHVIACPCGFVYDSVSYGNANNLTGLDCRVCVIFNNGQIYHNYPSCNDTCDFYNPTITNRGNTRKVEDMFLKFDESVVWDLPSRKHPVKTTTGDNATLIATGKYYYNPALADKCYEMHPALNASNGYGNTVGFPATNEINPATRHNTDVEERCRFWRPDMEDERANPFRYMGGYITEHHYSMIATYQTNNGSNPSRICVFGTQDGGRSWYCMYEFAHFKDCKLGSPLIQEGSASSDIYTVKKRTIIVPNAENKEPSSPFSYGSPINVSSIVGDGEKVTITTSSAHGYSNGDIVVVGLQSNVSINGRTFDWMVNSSADSSTGGNGVLFVVNDVTSTTFTASLDVHNPDGTLPARHIHALNHCKDGVSISTGEEYPDGGWLLYNPIRQADGFGGYNVANLSTQNIPVRLTSVNTAVRRALGFILQQEGLDTYIYVGVDTADITQNFIPLPEGRTDKFEHNSCGVWKIPIDGVDDMKDTAMMKFNGTRACYGFQQFGNAMVFIGEHDEFAISFDNGENWISSILPCTETSRHFSGMTYDRRFSIDNILVQLKR